MSLDAPLSPPETSAPTTTTAVVPAMQFVPDVPSGGGTPSDCPSQAHCVTSDESMDGVEKGTINVDCPNDDDDDDGASDQATTSLTRNAFNIFKSNVAGGMFLFPMVMGKGGYLLGPALAIPIWIMVTDCVFMLLDTKLKINHRLVQTYPQVIGFVFGRLGRIICSIALVSSQLLYCMMYFQIIGDTVSKMDFINSEFGSDGYYIFAAASLAFILPSTFFSDKMGIVAYVSAGALFFILVTYIICVGYSIKGLVDHGPIGDKVGPISELPLFLTCAMSNLEGIPVILPVENSTRKEDKKKVPYVVVGIFGVVMVMYLIIGITGNLAFGEALTTTIVSALPSGGFALAARIALAGIALFTYPLLWVPAIETIDAALGVPHGDCRRNWKAITARIVITCILCGIALVLGAEAILLLSAFVGATGSMCLAVLFPPFLRLHLEVAMETPEHERSGLKYLSKLFVGQRVTLVRVKCWAYIAIGLVMSGFSLEAFFRLMIQKL